MAEKSSKKSSAVIIALAVAILLGVVVLVVAVMSLVGSGDNKKQADTTKYILTEPKETEAKTTNNLAGYFDESMDSVQDSVNGNGAYAGSQGSVQAGDSATVTVSVTKADSKEDPIKHYENLQKNGDNVLSDYHDNKYIKLVSKKYNVDAEKLVAIYSQPDTGNNFVLQFYDKRDEDGNIVKSPDTLEKLYLIDEDGNVCVATGKTTGNEGVSYAEGTLSFYMVKTIVMPQYPDYFVGVEEK